MQTSLHRDARDDASLLRPRLKVTLSERLLPISDGAQDSNGVPTAPLSGDEESRPAAGGDKPQALGVKERLRHFTWTWFTLTMATGGIANVMYNSKLETYKTTEKLFQATTANSVLAAVPGPFRFHGLYAIGNIFFLSNIVFFIFNCVCISLRFYYWPDTFKSSFLHPTESLFVPAFVISIATILLNISEHALSPNKTGPWLIAVMAVLFWVYCGLAMVFTASMYLLIWSTQTFTIAQMTPAWIFPAYPLLLVGPLAGALTQPPTGASDMRALRIIIGGIVSQGVGFMVSLLSNSSYFYRLMTHKLPAETSRPAMFISVGPSGFTITALISLGFNLPSAVTTDFMGNGELAGQVSKILAFWAGLWLWGLSIFFFLVSAGAHWSCISHGSMQFSMRWNAFIFPNTALATATFAIARALDDTPIAIIGCIMACALVASWFFVFIMMLRAIWQKQLLWPEKQEDRDEEAFLKDLEKKQMKDSAHGKRTVVRVDGKPPARKASSDPTGAGAGAFSGPPYMAPLTPGATPTVENSFDAHED